MGRLWSRIAGSEASPTPADFRAVPDESGMPAEVAPPRRDGSEALTVRSALGLIPVFRSVQIISTACGQLPMGVWRQGVELVPTPAVVERPDVVRTRRDFVKRTVVNLATTGNAYLLASYDDRGQAKNVRTLAPSSVSVRFDDRGTKLFDVTDNGRTRTYGTREVKHLRFVEVDGDVLGLGPIQAARLALQGHRETRDYSAGWLRTGGVPSGLLTTDQHLDPESAGALKEAWYRSLEDGSTAVMSQGMKYQTVTLDPASVQWLESMQYGVADVARLFGIPPVKLLAAVESSSLTYSNISDLNKAFVQDTLMEYLGLIEDAMSEIVPRGQEVRFKLDEFLRADERTRFEAYEIALRAGVLTVAEVREREGLQPLPAPGPEPAPEEAA